MNFDRPHRRLNLLTGQWVLVSPHRGKRPWLGQMEKAVVESLPPYDPTCYLCPENKRSGGAFQNPPYTGTYVFDNDFPSLLLPENGEGFGREDLGLFVAEEETGTCRVICFSPRHDLTLPELDQSQVETVIRTWAAQTAELSALDYVQYVQVFENKGAVMGCSNPHPHSQVWATGHIPNDPALELLQQDAYLKQHGSCLLCDYVTEERKRGERVVASNDQFTALVPFWAVWPFEVMVVANEHVASLPDLNPAQVAGLADVFRKVTTQYDNLFEVSFPYSMGFHQGTFDGVDHPGQHLHAHFFPPLLRSATVRKFMVGFELLSMPQRDLTAETAAARLRDLSLVHYKQR
jgi:UDPglucose--hexose-1-phosphate uridylyltransferase